ncbi:myb-related transcription factor, partner of profilin-like [Pomacea canaliculata]|uniref:myb-related transcription factor, partner of profilin-like n=1 Tax=Pomacea canaliculata TaxID=400727 RepID=UPI000D72DC16|nr:myb-related transcription factor, partner of profilin-like [Pomacea canaliculata]
MRYCACVCFERSVFPFPPRPCSCREMEAKRLRKSNFSEMEIKILLHEISMESELLSSCFSNKVTLQKKQEIWKNIAAKVSACGVAVRTVAEIKDKWGLLKRTTLQKKRDAYKTGGGKGMPPPEYEDTVVAILGNNTSLINGIAGNATDSFVAGLEETQPSVSKSEGVTEEITQSVRPLTTESAPCLNNSLTCNKENEFSSPSTSLADLYPSTPLSMDNRETFGIKKKKSQQRR